jgi:hypothetical protein
MKVVVVIAARGGKRRRFVGLIATDFPVKREPPEKTWIDPDTGLTCHEILNGLGSECSNF